MHILKNKPNYILAVFTFVLLLALTSCSSQPTGKSNWKTYAKSDFSIQYPNTWVLDTTDTRTSFILRYQNNLTWNMILKIVPADNHTLEEICDIYEENYKQAFSDVNIYYNKLMRKGGKKYHQMVIGFTKEAGHPIKIEQRSWVKNNRLYQLIFGTSPEDFEKTQKAAEEVMDTFEVK